MKRFLIALLALVALGGASREANAQDFKVIVNSANATEELTADQAAKIFLKQATKFPAGAAATPVDQAKGAAVRAAFSKAVLGKSVAAVETYWQQQIFSGKDVPPATKASDDDIVAFVKGNAGAIGYVSAGTAVAGVKVVSIK
jgi:ABC-type phosphate transport system substrate-binding protein